MPEAKPYDISKQVVWEAYLKVKANHGAAGVDGESIEAFEYRLEGITSTRSGIGCLRGATSHRRCVSWRSRKRPGVRGRWEFRSFIHTAPLCNGIGD